VKIIFKNIGFFKEAELELKGLTVLAGENDTGKSTLGRLIFSMVKAEHFSKERFFRENRNRFINLKFNEIKAFLKILKIGYENKIEEIKKKVFKILKSKNKEQFKKQQFKEVEKEINFIINQVKKNEINVESLLQNFEKIKEAFDENGFKVKFRNLVLKRMITTNFKDSIVSKFSNVNEARIEYENGKIVINAQSEDDIFVLRFDNFFYFKDATIIETPVVLQIGDVLSRISYEFTYKDEQWENYPYTFRDLILKIFKFKRDIDISEEEEKKTELIKILLNILPGKVEYKEGSLKYYYKTHSFNILSTATGVKSFAILYLLLQRGFLTSYKNILIVDEPEIHLHPRWQIEYAKFLIELVKRGTFVLVNTHSPYIVEAIETFRKKEKILDRIKFYLSEKYENNGEVFCVLKDVTSSTEEIYQKLYIPLEELEQIAIENE